MLGVEAPLKGRVGAILVSSSVRVVSFHISWRMCGIELVQPRQGKLSDHGRMRISSLTRRLVSRWRVFWSPGVRLRPALPRSFVGYSFACPWMLWGVLKKKKKNSFDVSCDSLLSAIKNDSKKKKKTDPSGLLFPTCSRKRKK